MALASTTVWEVRSSGNDDNGGGFNPSQVSAGTDYTQQNAAQLTLTDLACASNTTLTSVTGGFTAAMVGNVIQIKSGTNAAAGWYEITAYTDTNTVAIDRTCASGGDMTSGTGSVGGALATPGKVGAAHVASNTIWIKRASNYTITSTSNNVSNGRMTLLSGTAAAPTVMRGYDSARWDEGDRPTLIWGVNGGFGPGIVTVGAYSTLDNLIFDGVAGTYTGTSLVTAPSGNGAVRAFRCTFQNCVFSAFDGSNRDFMLFACEFAGNTNRIFNMNSAASVQLMYCHFHDNPSIYAVVYGTCQNSFNARGCIFENNKSGSEGGGIRLTGAGRVHAVENCDFYNNHHGVDFDVALSADVLNCHFESNAGYGINCDATSPFVFVRNCSHYNNTSGLYDTVTPRIPTSNVSGTQTCSSSAYVTAGTDYTKNSTVNAGSLCRSSAYPSTWLGATGTLNRNDIGAVGHADPTQPAVGDVRSGVSYNDGNSTGTLASSGGACPVITAG